MSRICCFLFVALCTTAPRAVAETATLYWSNRDNLNGALVGADSEQLTWQTPMFVDPLRVKLDTLRAIRFPFEEGDQHSQEPIRFMMRNGDTLTGSLRAIDDTWIEIASKRHGQLKLARKQVLALQRLDNPALIYLGPQGLKQWVPTNRRARSAWTDGSDGRISTAKEDAPMFRQLPIEGAVEIEVVLESTQRPAFLLGLSNRAKLPPNRDDVDDVHLDVWEDDLVATSENDFELLMSLEETTRRVHLKLYLDLNKGRFAVYSGTGKQLNSIGVKKKFHAPPGIFIQNKGKDLSLTRVRVSQWNGQPPRELKESDTRVHLINGDIRYGRLQEYDNQRAALSLSSDGDQASIPLTEVDTVVLSLEEETPPGKGVCGVSWHDGEYLSGKLLRIQDGAVVIQAPYSDQPIQSQLDAARRIGLPTTVAEDAQEADRLYSSNGLLRGTLVGGTDANAPIRWRPTGGLNASPLAPHIRARFVRGQKELDAPYDPNAFRDLIYLTSGDVVPCRLESIDLKAVRVTTAFAEARQVPLEFVKAVEIATEGKVEQIGFADEGWRTVKGGPRAVDRAANELTFQQPASFGHPEALRGDDIRFKLRWKPERFSMVGLRLYARDIGKPAHTTDISFTCQGTRVIVSGGRQREQRFMFGAGGNTGINVDNNEATVQLTTRDGKVHVSVNDRNAHVERLNRKSLGGNGLLIEVGQNGFFGGSGSISISDFEVRNRRGSAVKRFVDAEARQRTLTVPRFRRQDPPTHVLIAPNGDLLRGRLVGFDGDIVRFESRLETFRFPRQRVTAIVWLHPTQTVLPPPPSGDAPPVRALLDGGLLLTMLPLRMVNGYLVGRSTILSECAVPIGSIRELHAGEFREVKDAPSYAQWTPTGAAQPRWATPTGNSAFPDGRRLVGETAADFELPTLEGESFKLNEHTDKVIVLDFWATWCGPCIRAMPEYLKAVAGFDPQKVMFVAVNQGESPRTVRDFLKTQDWQLNVVIDRGSEVSDQFHVGGIPHTVVLGPGGVVESVRVGFRPGGGAELRTTIEQILDGSWVRPAPVEGQETGGALSKWVGKRAADFDVKLADGKEFKLQDQRGKVTVLHFWATWSGPCVRAISEYTEVLEPFDANKVKLIAINQAESPQKIQECVAANQWDLTVALDADQKIARSYWVESIPHTVVVDARGRIAWTRAGFDAGATKELQSIVHELLTGNEAKQQEQKQQEPSEEKTAVTPPGESK